MAGIIGMFKTREGALKGMASMKLLQPNGKFKIKKTPNGYALWGTLLYNQLTGRKGTGGLF